MPSVYDMFLVKGSPRYRMNKGFIGKDKVPEQVLEVLTTENIVDENGTIIVDQKSDSQKSEESATSDDNTPPVEDPDHADAQPDPAPQAPVNNPAQDAIDQAEQERAAERAASVPAPSSANGADTPNADPSNVSEATPSLPGPQTPGFKPTPAKKEKLPTTRFKSRVPQTDAGMGFPRKNGKTVDIFDGKTPHTHIKAIGGLGVPLSAESFRTKTDGEIENRLRELGFQIIDFNTVDPNAADLNDDDTDDEV